MFFRLKPGQPQTGNLWYSSKQHLFGTVRRQTGPLVTGDSVTTKPPLPSPPRRQSAFVLRSIATFLVFGLNKNFFFFFLNSHSDVAENLMTVLLLRLRG